MSLTTEQVLALAPDASSAKSGKDLSAPRKWLTLGANETCAWGTFQGSGEKPYQTAIDLAEPAFKCTCPSRKFPCKHGLGLFLIYAQQPASMAEKTPPPWAVEWLTKRKAQEEKKAAKSVTPEKPLDPEAAAKAAAAAEKRAASRESRVTAALEELGVWLDDLVRTGFAALPGKPSSFWQNPAARLVDGQAPGMARRISALDGITTTGDRWPSRLLREAALLHLVRESWSRIASLPEATREDLRATLGFTIGQQELSVVPAVRDRWVVLGQRIWEEERLRVKRTWMFGAATRRPALSLSFSANPNQPLDISLVPGTTIDADLVYYPGAWPLRALVKERHGSPTAAVPELPHETIAAADAFAAAALTANPWIERVPFGLCAVTPLRLGESWWIRDTAGHALPLAIEDSKGWVLCALAGGHPCALAGEWDGEALTPLSVWTEGRFLSL